MEAGLVTVVVPVYNTEKYLDQCVQSIVDQTYTKLEILLIDDGSPDRCPKICDKWAEEDSRIKVIHKENQGLAMARNTGIEAATGEYICFIDSDDYIDKYTIEKAYLATKREQSDIVVFGFHSTNEECEVITSFVPCMDKSSYFGAEVQEVFLPELIAPNPKGDGRQRLYMSACMMLFAFDVIKANNWKFVSEKEIISEDVYSLLDLFQYVRSVCVLPEALYYYRTNMASVSRSYRPNRYDAIVHFYLESLRFCKESKYNEAVISRIAIPYLEFTIAAIKQLVNSDERYCYKRKELRRIVECKVLQAVLHDGMTGCTSIKKRLLFMAMRNKSADLCYLLAALRNMAQ